MAAKNNSPDNSELQPSDSSWKRWAFLIGISGMSLLSGFGYAIGVARKSDPQMFDKGLSRAQILHSSGSSLALRALGWGSIYAISGVTIFCGIIWKLSGAKNMAEFRIIAGNALPSVPKNDPPQSRTEFKNLTDLLQYIIDEDEIKKKNSKDNTMD